MGRGHGTEAIILSMPFWADLVEKLKGSTMLMFVLCGFLWQRVSVRLRKRL
jgi:hypothetical protein